MDSLYSAVTCHGTVLSLDLSCARICHVQTSELNARLVPLNLMTGGLFGARCLPFALDPAATYPVLPRPLSSDSGVFLSRAPAGHAVALRSIANGRYLAAIPGGTIDGDRAAVSRWELFTLKPHVEGLRPRTHGLEQFLARTKRLFSATVSWPDAMAILLADAPDEATAALVEAIWPLLTLSEFDSLAGRLVSDGALRNQLKDLYPGNLYAARTIPKLASALLGSDPANPLQTGPSDTWSRSWRREDAKQPALRATVATPDTIGPEFDHLARDGYDGALTSFAQACNASLRNRTVPGKGMAVVATARSEGVYLLEWIAYHRLLGFEAIFLYSNNNDDGSDTLLAALHHAGVVTWTQSVLAAGVSAQNKAYGHALNVNDSLLHYRWAMFMDLDEYLVLNPARYSSVVDFARWHEMRQTDAVGINWVMVGSSGQLRWSPLPLTRRNVHLLNEPNNHLKIMMAPRRFIQAHPHFPFADRRRSFVFRLADGSMHEHRKQPHGAYHARAFTDEPSGEHACLYHYNYKSVEEFAWKVSRNRGDFPMTHEINFDGLDEVAVGSFVGQHHSAEVTQNGRLAQCAPGLDAELSRLRGLPGVLDAERAVTSQFRVRLSVIRAQLLDNPRLSQLGPAGETMRALLRASIGQTD